MDCVIFYFSGTGNTELIAQKIKEKLDGLGNRAELVSIENINDYNKKIDTNTVIGFGFPVYKFSYPDIFDKAIIKIKNLSANNKYFLFSTYARFDAQAFYDFEKMVGKKDYNLIAQKSFKAPSCGISARKDENSFEYKSVMFFEDDIENKIEKYCDEIIAAYSENNKIKNKRMFLGGFKKRIVKDIEITKYPTLTIDQKRCTQCGLCVKKCPEKNLTRLEKTIKVNDSRECLHCLRCMNHCPSNAIDFGMLTKGENRYTLKKRDSLFKKSADGYKEIFWREFPSIVRKWRMDTIKYWIKNKRS